MLPCYSCYIYMAWRSKEVWGLKSSHGGKGFFLDLLLHYRIFNQSANDNCMRIY